jgi:hydroxymethylpyrimidine/phosphomethylpyrimidine kinase
MLATAPLVATVADGIASYGFPNYVCDPVMVATSGDRLLDAGAVRTVRERLLPLATLVTPNLHEAALLTERPVASPADMEAAGRVLVQLGAGAALVKGGHLTGDELEDVLVTAHDTAHFRRQRIATSSTHGTGCTLSAAVTAALALGHPLREAIAAALDFVHRAIAAAPGLGSGHGPLNHFVPPGLPDTPA